MRTNYFNFSKERVSIHIKILCIVIPPYCKGKTVISQCVVI